MMSIVALGLFGALLAATPCESLRSLALPNTTVTAAQLVPAGPFVAPGGRGQAPAAGAPAPAGGRGQRPAAQPPGITLLGHCCVAAVLKPSSDSHIEIEVWLPAENWNGKLLAVGNGGWAGEISYPAMASALQEGYATASTDTGHKGGGADASFALGHPEKVVDFAYRAVHEMTATSKSIITAFYDRAPRLAYWSGCSTGGRQGLMSAQRYPGDFDGIIAGAPANYHNHLTAWLLGLSVAYLSDHARALPPAKIALVNQAVLNACDARTRACSRTWEASKTTGCGCSWRRAWIIAEAGRVPISSTSLAPSSGGGNRASHPINSSALT